MPIEFRCESCTKLLRTPDESAGKKAKCPQCGAIVDVPLSGVGGAPPSDTPSDATTPPASTQQFGATPEISTPQSDSNPFGAMGPSKATPDSDNPYASPSLTSPVQQAKPAGAGELTHSKISMDDLLRTCWSITMENMGPMAIFGLVVFGINIALGIFNQVLGFAAQMTNQVAIVIGAQVLSISINLGAQTWIAVASILFAVKMARDRQADLSYLSKAGPYMWRYLGLTIVFAVLSIPVMLVFVGTPAAIAWITTRDPQITLISVIAGLLIGAFPAGMYIFLNFMLSMFFIVDRKTGIFEALGLSRTFMRGNKTTAFGIMIVFWILGGLFLIFTCCLGRIILDPFSFLLIALIYLTATGQPFQRPLK